MRFRRHSRQGSTSTTGSHGGHKFKVDVSKEDAHRMKVRTGNVHDPILTAVNEAQPFELALTGHNNQKTVSLEQYATQCQLSDSFGNPIPERDINNPTRNRNERPLDTIRSFEYSISGDPAYKEMLETPRYGFVPRSSYGRYPASPIDFATADGNPYDVAVRASFPNRTAPILSTNDPLTSPINGDFTQRTSNYTYQPVAVPPPPDTNDNKKKKRRSFFRRKRH